MENPRAVGEDFNLGHPTEISILSLAEKLWRISGRTEPMHVRHLPAFQYDVRRRSVEITKTRELLGWEPQIDLDEGLLGVLDWMKEYLKGETTAF